MSVPYSIIQCDECNYSATSSVLHGIFIWRDEMGNECNIERDLGICLNCADVVAIEELPSEPTQCGHRRLGLGDADTVLESPQKSKNRILSFFG